MEMTAAYMRKAAEFLVERGFSLAEERSELGEVEGGKCGSLRFVLTRGPDEHLVLELVEHPGEGERYFLELVRFHGLRSFSFPLDSWKFRGTSIELKYYALPDSGLGLALTLDLAPPAPGAEAPK
jgi:hypothetical protein